MSKTEARGSADEGTEHTEERIDQGRRDALTLFAKYTAPAMLAMLVSLEQGSSSNPMRQ